MEQRGQFSTSQIIDSLNGWWELAGADGTVTDSTVDWLALDAKPELAVDTQTKTASPPVLPAKIEIQWPRDIESLQRMVADGADLPGNRFGDRSVAPVGPKNARVMVISDVPDDDELVTRQLGSGATGKLLERMLMAIGITLTDCYWTTLAATVPATGELPDSALPGLADFVRHQINLVNPESIILLGSSACQALSGLDLMDARQNLRHFNYDGGKMAALTTFHPRTLLARPQMKAQAWKDLQMFVKKDNL